MTMHTYGPVAVYDARTHDGVPVTTATVVDALSGATVATFDLAGNARTVTTNSRGWVAQWRADAPSNALILDFNGVKLVVDSIESGAGGSSVTFGTTAGTAAEGNDTRITGAAQKASNLSDLANAATARTNLGLGTAATTASTAYAPTVHTHAGADIASGTVDTARLGSGTASATTFLRGDQTWATPAGGSSGALPGYQKMAASTAVRMWDANRVDANSFNTLNRLTFAPFYMAYGGNLLRHFYVNVGTTAATSVIRLGIYAAGTDGMPGSRVVDLGTVSGSAATGDVILSRAGGAEITLTPGLYFLSAVIQTAACTVARYVSSITPYGSGIYGEAPTTASGVASNGTIPYQDSVTGALPSTATITSISNVGIFMSARVQ